MRPENPICCPRRSDHIVEVGVDDDLLLFHFEHNRAHCLNADAADLWRRCDGKTPLDEIIPAGDETGYDVLARLHAEGLITGMSPGVRPRSITRRDFVRAGTAAAAGAAVLPLIQSIAIPGVAAAASGLPYDRSAPTTANSNPAIGDGTYGSDTLPANGASVKSEGTNPGGHSNATGSGTQNQSTGGQTGHGNAGSGSGVQNATRTSSGSASGTTNPGGNHGVSNGAGTSNPSTSVSGVTGSGGKTPSGNVTGGSSSMQGSGGWSADAGLNVEGGESDSQSESAFQQIIYRLKPR
jgi:hypothetical protein